MKINNLGLLNSLSFIINSENPENTDYTLAHFILNNLYRISSVSIWEMTEECFTSRSAVRRFCLRLGYDNFSALKNSISKLVFPSDLRHRDIKAEPDYRIHIKNLVDEMITDIDEQITDEDINYLCKLINQDVNVVILCANNTSGNALRFQQELMFASKVIHVISGSFTTNEILKLLHEEDVIITISASGKFAELSLEFVQSLKGHKFLITGNKAEKLKNSYDKTFYISKDGFSADYLGIYGKYGITYILDLLSMQYLSLYT